MELVRYDAMIKAIAICESVDEVKDIRDNAIALCRECHNSFGKEPCVWTDFIDAKWPGRRDRLILKMQGIGKNTPEIRQMISTHYNREYRRMEKTGDRTFETWN